MNDKAQHEPYKVHLADVSYFSGKLETYLRYKEIPFERIEMDATSGVNQVYANTGQLGRQDFQVASAHDLSPGRWSDRRVRAKY